MGDSGGGSSTTKTEPWEGVQPYLTEMYSMLFGSGGSSGSSSGTSSGSSGSSSGSSGSSGSDNYFTSWTDPYTSSSSSSGSPTWVESDLWSSGGYWQYPDGTMSDSNGSGTTSSGSSSSGSSSGSTGLAYTPLQYYQGDLVADYNKLGSDLYGSVSGALVDNATLQNMSNTANNLMSGSVNIDPSTYSASLLGDTYQINTPSKITTPTVGDVNVQTAQADDQTLNYGYQGQLDKVAGGDYTKVSSNPYLQEAINYAVQPLTDTLTKSTLPGINTDAVSAGRYGSGAWSDLYSQALSDYERNVLGTSSQMASDAYNKGLDTMMSGLSLGADLSKTQFQGNVDIANQNAALAQDAYNKAAELEMQGNLAEADYAYQAAELYAKQAYDAQVQMGEWQSQYDLADQAALNAASQYNATNTQNAAVSSAELTNQMNDLGLNAADSYYDNLNTGYNTASNISQTYQDYLQSIIDAEMAKWDFDQMEPWNRVFNIANILYGTPWGSTLSTTS